MHKIRCFADWSKFVLILACALGSLTDRQITNMLSGACYCGSLIANSLNM